MIRTGILALLSYHFVYLGPMLYAQHRLPNVVIVLADDLGYGDLQCYNENSKIPTPYCNQLAREGLRFTDAHSSSGICTPSRYALLQGRYHWRKFHRIVIPFGQPILDDEKTTMAEMFKSKGYNTACIGKWHLGWNWDALRRPGVSKKKQYEPNDYNWKLKLTGGALSHGFDYYFGDDVPNYPPFCWIENESIVQAPTVMMKQTQKPAEGSWEAPPGPSVKDWDFWAVMPTLTRKAVHWINKQSKDKPFFLYFPCTSPHAPIIPTKDFQGKSQANGYGDYVAQTDDSLGQILRALKDKGFADNTIVIVTSDNGPEQYAYNRIKNFNHRSMGALRGLKRDVWEGGHRVPMIIRWPGKIKENSVSTALASHIDLFRTLAEVIQFSIPKNSAEDSLSQLAHWRNLGPSTRTELVHNTYANAFALRSGDWLYLDAPSGTVTPVPAWVQEAEKYSTNTHAGALYDLKKDLGQKKNLYADYPEKVKQFKERLAALKKQP